MSKSKLLSQDEMLRVITIDRKKKRRLDISLRKGEDDKVELNDVIEPLTEYVTDMMSSDEDNVTKQQIFPLMAQAAARALIKMAGAHGASVIMSAEHVRYALIHVMMVGFYLMKFVQKHGIKIDSLEEPLSDDDLEMFDRVNAAANVTAMATHLGADPKEVVRELLQSGQLRREDLEMLGAEHLAPSEEEIRNAKSSDPEGGSN
jgi:hypothetical protein